MSYYFRKSVFINYLFARCTPVWTPNSRRSIRACFPLSLWTRTIRRAPDPGQCEITSDTCWEKNVRNNGVGRLLGFIRSQTEKTKNKKQSLQKSLSNRVTSTRHTSIMHVDDGAYRYELSIVKSSEKSDQKFVLEKNTWRYWYVTNGVPKTVIVIVIDSRRRR